MTIVTLKERDNLNRSTCIIEIESIIDNFLKQKAPVPDGFIMNSTKYLRNNVFWSTEAERIILNSFYEITITLIPKPNNALQENYRLVSVMNIYTKILNKLLTKRLPNHQHNIKEE